MCLGNLVAGFIRRDTKKHDDVRIAKQTPPSGVTVEEYAYLPDGDPMHMLNVYRPEGARGVLPLIVNIHGGAWVYGDKELNKYYCMYLASRGYCVVGMSYRLMPDVTLKEQVGDVFASMLFVSKNAERFGADVGNVMLTGDSAGGHLASLAACIMRSEKLQKIYGVTPPGLTVRCLALSHPVCRVHDIFLRPDLSAKRRGFVQHVFDGIMFGKARGKDPVYPFSAFTEYTDGLTLPPVFLMGCERDVYDRQVRWLAGELEKAQREGRCPEFVFDRVSVAEETIKLRHVYNIVHYEWEESKRVNDLSLRFFSRHMA